MFMIYSFIDIGILHSVHKYRFTYKIQNTFDNLLFKNRLFIPFYRIFGWDVGTDKIRYFEEFGNIREIYEYFGTEFLLPNTWFRIFKYSVIPTEFNHLDNSY